MELLPDCCSSYLQTLGIYPARLWLLSHLAFLSGPQFKVWRGACGKGIGEFCADAPPLPTSHHPHMSWVIIWWRELVEGVGQEEERG